jgi:hypothetical protein
MNRFALVLILSAAMGYSAWATPAAAFDTNSESAINPDGSSRFADPDDQPMPGLSQVAPDVQAYRGVTDQPTPDQSGWIFSAAPQR